MYPAANGVLGELLGAARTQDGSRARRPECAIARGKGRGGCRSTRTLLPPSVRQPVDRSAAIRDRERSMTEAANAIMPVIQGHRAAAAPGRHLQFARSPAGHVQLDAPQVPRSAGATLRRCTPLRNALWRCCATSQGRQARGMATDRAVSDGLSVRPPGHRPGIRGARPIAGLRQNPAQVDNCLGVDVYVAGKVEILGLEPYGDGSLTACSSSTEPTASSSDSAGRPRCCGPPEAGGSGVRQNAPGRRGADSSHRTSDRSLDCSPFRLVIRG
jgi:hypothetical protein